MRTTVGEKGLRESYQDDFPGRVKCCRCKGKALFAFVAHEGIALDDGLDLHTKSVSSLHLNEGPGGSWPHSLIAVAVYFCPICSEPTALFNQQLKVIPHD